ncbi:MAG: DoxX family protein [Candidatus Marinimicrobia bacterium]|nr:DoxX family protein [Candidatus Neomarinimicrobiota bacterium]
MDFLNRYANIVHWLPRLSLGAIFLYHGALKFPGAEMMASMMGMPIMMIYMLAVMEVVAGALIIAGGAGRDIFTRIAGGIIAAVMMGAILMIHIKFGWNGVLVAEQGVELQLFIFTMGMYFLVKGNDAN